MELVHVVFDDKKIEGLQDGDFHESLKFDNVEIVCEDSNDEMIKNQYLRKMQKNLQLMKHIIQHPSSYKMLHPSGDNLPYQSGDNQLHPSGHKVHHPSEH